MICILHIAEDSQIQEVIDLALISVFYIDIIRVLLGSDKGVTGVYIIGVLGVNLCVYIDIIRVILGSYEGITGVYNSGLIPHISEDSQIQEVTSLISIFMVV
jgi:hypothetical protein